jgi:hypothetical protein
VRRLFVPLVVLLVLGVSACGGGGGKDSAQTIPAKPELTVPGDQQAPVVTTETDTTTTETTQTDTTGSGAQTGGTQSSGSGGQSSPSGSAGSPSGGTTAPSSQGTPQNNTGGTPSDRFEKFCKENPGAC